ncbi:MAG: hypothetical protein ACJ8F1_11945 [Polyangia bacterium]
MPRLHVVILLSQVVLSVGCSSNLPQTSGSGGSSGGAIAGQTGSGGQAGAVAGGPGGVGGGAGFGVNDPAGHSGTGGVAGSGGIGGVGGAAGGLPVCVQGGAGGGGGAASPVTIESCAYDAAAQPVLTSVSAAVTVVSADSFSSGNCPFFFFPFLPKSSTPSTKLVLESADQTRWTIYLQIPNLPADTIRVGDTLDLAITAQTAFFQGNEQAITLARDGKLIAFSYSGWQTGFNNFQTFGITLGDDGPVCSVVGCGYVPHALHVAHGTETADIRQGETRQVGDVSISLAQYLHWQDGVGTATGIINGLPIGGCDASHKLLVGGFTVSP